MDYNEHSNYQSVDPRAIKSWRIGRAFSLLVILAITVPLGIFLWNSDWNSIWKSVILAAEAVVIVYAVISLVVFPTIEYRQWGYLIEEDKVVIRHGIFFVNITVIPVIRIQNITVSQGPINRRLGLYEVEISLASGSFSIEGLSEETAHSISENLKTRLYQRVAEKGVL